MKIAVCDDDKAEREHIAALVKTHEPSAEVITFDSGEELLKYKGSFSVYFLDISMKKISGIDTAGYIRKAEESKGLSGSVIIFVTGYREYMPAAFDVNAFHYLLKPVNEEKFSEVFKRAYKEAAAAEEQNHKYIMIKSSGMQRRLLLCDINYIESNNKKVIFHTRDSNLETYGKMDELERLLAPVFYRCHRCYLVNMEKISAYSADTIQLLTGEQLILARKKYPDFVKAYMRYARNGGIVNV